MKRKKFGWLGIILISLILQFAVLQFLLFIEIKLLPALSFALLVKVNFFITAIVGGLIVTRFYLKYSPHMGGICAALFIFVSELYSAHFAITSTGVFVLLVAYLAGYVGSSLYSSFKLVVKRSR